MKNLVKLVLRYLPKPSEDRILRWLNDEASRYNGDPLAALPPGLRDDPDACPLATGLQQSLHADVHVAGSFFKVTDKETGKLIDERKLPLIVLLFIMTFDLGRYPGLDKTRMTPEDLAKINEARRAERNSLETLERAVAEASGREPRSLKDLTYQP